MISLKQTPPCWILLTFQVFSVTYLSQPPHLVPLLSLSKGHTFNITSLCVCLSRGWGFCLDDRPSKRDLTTPLARLGVRYTTHHQCQLQYGPNATFCHEVDVSTLHLSTNLNVRNLLENSPHCMWIFFQNICQILWCSVNGSCRSKLDSPIDGTRCGPEKVGGASSFVLLGCGFL